MPELDSITVKGFKSLASIEGLRLGSINVVIGPNGSGKNFIGVFFFLHAIRAGHLQDYVVKAGGADAGGPVAGARNLAFRRATFLAEWAICDAMLSRGAVNSGARART